LATGLGARHEGVGSGRAHVRIRTATRRPIRRQSLARLARTRQARQAQPPRARPHRRARDPRHPDQVKVSYVFGSGKAPLIIVIVISALVGIVLAYFAERIPRKRR